MIKHIRAKTDLPGFTSGRKYELNPHVDPTWIVEKGALVMGVMTDVTDDLGRIRILILPFHDENEFEVISGD